MLLDKTILELATGLRSGEFTSVDLVNECYDNIAKYNDKVNAFITIIPRETALKQAQEIDCKLKIACLR